VNRTTLNYRITRLALLTASAITLAATVGGSKWL
jgi:hypothetical protein